MKTIPAHQVVAKMVVQVNVLESVAQRVNQHVLANAPRAVKTTVRELVAVAVAVPYARVATSIDM